MVLDTIVMKNLVFYTIKEIQQMLKVKSPATIYNYIERGLLPYHQIGKFRRITDDDLQVFLRNCKPTNSLSKSDS